jgi:hypothetical protein
MALGADRVPLPGAEGIDIEAAVTFVRNAAEVHSVIAEVRVGTLVLGGRGERRPVTEEAEGEISPLYAWPDLRSRSR